MKSVATVHAVQEHHERHGIVGRHLRWHVSAAASMLAREQILLVVEFEVERFPCA
jgi:hypothetical protein